MIHYVHHDKFTHDFHRWCERFCVYFDTATVAVFAFAIGLILGELTNSGFYVVVRMIAFLAASTVLMFSMLAVWGLRYERRESYRRWVTAIIGAMTTVVYFRAYPVLPDIAVNAMELITLAMVAVFFSRHSEWCCKNKC